MQVCIFFETKYIYFSYLIFQIHIMDKTASDILIHIQGHINQDLPKVREILGISNNHPELKEKHAEVLLNGWESVKDNFIKKWIPAMTYQKEMEVVSFLKQEKSMHSIYDFIKEEYKFHIIQSLGLDKQEMEKIDPDAFDKIDELSFESNIAYNTLISIMNEHLEIFLADPYENESEIREDAEDLWLNEVYERIMIEFIQYGKSVVEELDNFAKLKGYIDGFDKDMLHDIYNALFEEKISEIKMVREINKKA